MSANNEFVRNLLTEQRKRLAAALLVYLEQNVYPKLSRPEQEALRSKVLAAVGAYHDTCLDIIKASVDDGSTAQNQLAIEVRALTGQLSTFLEEASSGR